MHTLVQVTEEVNVTAVSAQGVLNEMRQQAGLVGRSAG